MYWLEHLRALYSNLARFLSLEAGKGFEELPQAGLYQVFSDMLIIVLPKFLPILQSYIEKTNSRDFGVFSPCPF